jgi:hypothetical protein
VSTAHPKDPVTLPGTRSQSCLPLPTMRLQLLVAVGVFLSAHVTIVFHIAFVKILADVIVALNVIGSQIPVPVSIDGIEIRMRRGCALHIVFVDIV